MSPQHIQGAPERSKFRDSRWLIAAELALVAAVFVADKYHHIFFIKTPYLLALGWLSLIVRARRWRDVGLCVPRNWRSLVLIGLVAGIAMELLELFATQPLLVALTGIYPDLSDFHALVGNVSILLLAVGASWLLAGIGEELVWRGYLLNRLADLLGRSRLSWSISIGVVSLMFGLAHSHQGLTGIVENGVDGALLALLYIACGRNLIPPILAHGITDTLDSLIIFSGHYPGMHFDYGVTAPCGRRHNARCDVRLCPPDRSFPHANVLAAATPTRSIYCSSFMCTPSFFDDDSVDGTPQRVQYGPGRGSCPCGSLGRCLSVMPVYGAMALKRVFNMNWGRDFSSEPRIALNPCWRVRHHDRRSIDIRATSRVEASLGLTSCPRTTLLVGHAP